MDSKNSIKDTNTQKKLSTFKTYSFFKEGLGWSIDVPQYLEQGGNKASLKMVDGTDEILNLIARGKKQVRIQMDTAPFDGADLLELAELCDAPKGGGYYVMRTCRSKPFNRRMWLCDIVLFVFGDMPQQIYVRKEAQTDQSSILEPVA